MKPTQQPPEQHTPVDLDAHATVPQLHARAAQDYTANQTAARDKQQQGGPGVRQGVLPGGGR